MQFVKVKPGVYYNIECIESIIESLYGVGLTLRIANAAVKLKMRADDLMLLLNTDKVLIDVSPYYMD